jgi:DNA polymerase III alpha subunit (gram-positive type)
MFRFVLSPQLLQSSRPMTIIMRVCLKRSRQIILSRTFSGIAAVSNERLIRTEKDWKLMEEKGKNLEKLMLEEKEMQLEEMQKQLEKQLEEIEKKIQEKDKQIEEKEKQVQEKEKQMEKKIQEIDKQIEEKEKQVQEKEKQVQEMEEQMEKQMQEWEKQVQEFNNQFEEENKLREENRQKITELQGTLILEKGRYRGLATMRPLLIYYASVFGVSIDDIAHWSLEPNSSNLTEEAKELLLTFGQVEATHQDIASELKNLNIGLFKSEYFYHQLSHAGFYCGGPEPLRFATALSIVASQRKLAIKAQEKHIDFFEFSVNLCNENWKPVKVIEKGKVRDIIKTEVSQTQTETESG